MLSLTKGIDSDRSVGRELIEWVLTCGVECRLSIQVENSRRQPLVVAKSRWVGEGWIGNVGSADISSYV